MLPGKLFRTMIKQLCMRYTPSGGVDSDADFFNYIESNYFAAKRRISNISKASLAERDAVQEALFVFAIGIFSFGKIDAADDIISCLPSSGNLRCLALSLKALLPLPDDLDPLKNSENVMLWYKTNRTHLKWNELRGVYEKGHCKKHLKYQRGDLVQFSAGIQIR